MPVPTTLSIDELATLATRKGPYALAKALGIHYSGDSNPIDYGGFFYTVDDWQSWGYSDCVAICATDDYDKRESRSTPVVIVESGSISKTHLKSALGSCGYLNNPGVDTSDVHVHIDACRCYSGYDPSEDFSGSDTRAYKTENWNKRRLWRSVIKNYLLPLSRQS